MALLEGQNPQNHILCLSITPGQVSWVPGHSLGRVGMTLPDES